jgi:hypothetical protein
LVGGWLLRQLVFGPRVPPEIREACGRFNDAYAEAVAETEREQERFVGTEPAHPPTEADVWSTSMQAKLEEAALIASRVKDEKWQSLSFALEEAAKRLNPLNVDNPDVDTSRGAKQEALSHIADACLERENGLQGASSTEGMLFDWVGTGSTAGIFGIGLLVFILDMSSEPDIKPQWWPHGWKDLTPRCIPSRS